VYWHFKDKADLFNAMVDRVALLLEESLAHACSGIRQALLRIVTDPQTRRVFEVATMKVEYIDEMQAVRLRHLRVRSSFLEQIEHGLSASALDQATVVRVPAATASLGLHALLDGLIQNWLLDNDAFHLVEVGQQVMTVYLTGLGLAPEG
jgi:TetR/AcrR family acrAB operon transcriptional repressor